jgi:uncharacterized protein YheU (UPF0270 family)
MTQPDEPEQQDQDYVVVAPEALSAEALSALIEEFVTREGTDYGLREHTLEDKVRSVRRQLERGDVVIAFDLRLSSATLLTRADLTRLTRAQSS